MLDVERLQEQYCAKVSRSHRKAMGQFFTPRWIASGLAAWVMAARPSSIVDPAFGLGVLLDECRQQGFEGQATGYEIDAELIRMWRAADGGASGIQVQEADFLTVAPPLDAVIANPPYNRFQNRALSAQVKTLLHRATGEMASGYTNQYALYLYATLFRLAEKGRAAFIVPSEFLATGYGVQVKRFLLESGRLRHMVLFDTQVRVFPEAATTACVLLFDRVGQDRLDVWHLDGEASADLYLELCREKSGRSADASLRYAELDPADNWQGLGRGTPEFAGMTTLRQFGQVKRGIATGANEFFVLTAEQAAARGLESAALRRCIAGAVQAAEPVFTEQSWEMLRQSNRPAYLFDGCGSSSRAVAAYLRHGEAQGFHERYLTRTRKPWFRLEQREPAKLLLAVFGREGFRAVLNQSGVLNLTAFHAYYPSTGWEAFTGLLWLYLQTDLARQAFDRQNRLYGDGLKKLEPGDWHKLLVPDWRRWSAEGLRRGDSLAQTAAVALAPGRFADAVSAFERLIQEEGADGTPGLDDSVVRGQLELV